MNLPPKTKRTRIKKLVADLNYDFRSFELEHFIDHLNARRLRPISLHLFQTEFNIGLWLRGSILDYIVVPQSAHTHPAHQEHIALHEIAHILLDHPTKPADQLYEVQLGGFDQISANVLTGVLARKHDNLLDEPIEVEAEYMARLIKHRIIDAKLRYTWNGQLSSINGMDTIAENLKFFDSGSERCIDK